MNRFGRANQLGNPSVILTHRSSRGLSFEKHVRTGSTDSLTASSANHVSAYSVNSVNKNLLTLSPFRPMPIVESDISLMRLSFWCECFWYVLNRGIASSGRAVFERYSRFSKNLARSWRTLWHEYCEHYDRIIESWTRKRHGSRKLPVAHSDRGQ